MNKKFLLSLLLLIVIAQTATAALTLTFNEPSANTVYNNTAMNRPTIDVNVKVVDDNASQTDYNISIRWYTTSSLESSGTAIVTDWNAINYTNADMNCVGNTVLAWTTGKSCTYKWTIPLNSSMPPDSYYLDFNVVAYNHMATTKFGQYDANATVRIVINNSISTLSTIKLLLRTIMIGVVLCAILGTFGLWYFARVSPDDLARYAFVLGFVAIVVLLVCGFMYTILQ